MTDFVTRLSALRRPRLLIRAARFGLTDYNRARDLKRLMRTTTVPSPAHAVGSLMNEEARLEETRQAGDANYRVAHHIEVLIALMAEAQLLPQPAQNV
ncbi:MAG: DUF6477 family protein [Paracoccaceae bacterium]